METAELVEMAAMVTRKRRRRDNWIIKTDAYKMRHFKLYPKDTKIISSYLESRGGRFNETLFFGLQIFIKEYIEGVKIEQWMIDDAEEFAEQVFLTKGCFNREGWQRIVDVHGGRLPICIKAVPEGMVISTRNVLATIENTDEQLPWLVGHIETLLMQIWYPISVATLSYQIKQLIGRYCEQTGATLSPFHLNDFGYRGVSSCESAGRGGAAHLVNFLGTDTLEGIVYAQEYYNAGNCGHSVAATEHSTTTIFGKENEIEAYKHFIAEIPSGILSVVSDSYDIYHTVDVIFGQLLAKQIMARDGKFVVRPDSGDPPTMCVRMLKTLHNRFPGPTNKMGYKNLHPKIGIIYGDGINYESIDDICRAIMAAGFSLDNVVFGMGGALLQQVNRDTHKFAFKCSFAIVGSEEREVFKQPVTDPGKDSKRGRLKLIRIEGAHGSVYATVPENHPGQDIMQVVFLNGELLIDQTFRDIRAMAGGFQNIA